MVAEGWTSYANSLPAAQGVLRSELLRIVPELRDGRWVLVLDNPVVATMLTQSADIIMAGVRQALNCPEFNYELEVHEGELPPRFWSQKKVLESMLQEPTFRAFYDKLKLTLV